MTSTADKIATLWPEIVLLMGAVSCLVTGLHASPTARRWTPGVAAISLLAALIVAVVVGSGASPMGYDGLTTWVRVLGYTLGLGLLGVSIGLPDRAERHASGEAPAGASPAEAGGFNPGRSIKGEYYAFFLLSLSGLGMVAAAGDLVWLFLALELVSLPTYVMIATARPTAGAHESAVKYFFLGAMSAAVFLYGFALVYGATGFTDLEAIRLSVAATGPTPLMLAGLALAIVGLCFKTACFPMHGYAADVYEGAPTPVAAYLAVVPKAAGFVALVLVLGTVGWPLPVPLVVLLSVIAVITMTLGNVLALVQTKLKRVMAYSSVAHSGYLVLGLLAGPAVLAGTTALPDDEGLLSVAGAGNGLAGLLFYLLSYALATVTAMAIIGLLRTPSVASEGPDAEEAESSPGYTDLAGLRHRHPVLGLALLLSMLSLMGVPPLIGFVGKVVLALPVMEMGLWPLVVALVINSAISAVYYLRIAVTALGGRRPGNRAAEDAGPLLYAPFRGGVAIAAAVGLVVGGTFLAAWAFDSADRAFDANASPRIEAAAVAAAPAGPAG
ncbi:NADH-quinone oxidoreductase subunit N [Phycisphaera mikurensis]|uniref:NADH-quinone oxidoreductase subunit N n=1 Tax=Phycisphaera mikurensis (strain NBRC 102666 / KCTC 22515 / FYK2301M01) TaxID=1142394 RepID=I0IEM0_PHYMF|nr:NADH-quinone oxidoreductase subunit N [Phycisphaera mikurensis]MBB6441506.1 NADH-quinone oxidoreductase subunit N [Phycisphaera mikurensis]BAM03708.1 putative NADH-quinone oxidoreductase subunit N [Phycisphaera mikurensis NBRC 102666]